MDTEELVTLNPLHYSLVDVNGGMLSPPFPVVHDQLLCLADVEGEVVVLAPHCHFSDLLPVGCLIVVDEQAYHRRVVSKLNGVGVVCVHTVVVNREYRRGLILVMSFEDTIGLNAKL